ncbi:calpain-B-like [Stegodyphus dumicola]|uniref:calpain-B-like n=1 Tax=Stegodyphus dumicola TaxID=202533 RepID=UPI0015B1D3DB|nr:calpain-B-like [Stegodyphus dumicola]
MKDVAPVVSKICYKTETLGTGKIQLNIRKATTQNVLGSKLVELLGISRRMKPEDLAGIRTLDFSKASRMRSQLRHKGTRLHGSYEALEGGQAMDALVDLTSGLSERYDLESAPLNLYQFLLQASSGGAFITCSRKGDWQMANAADPNGLVSGHAYTVTAVAKVPMKDGNRVNLVRIRNPWGNDVEWNGSWNDNDSRWSEVDLHTKYQLEWRRRDDGEFWMEYKDFCREFEEVTICTLGPDFDGDGVAEEAGMVKAIRGKWEVPKTSGGSRNNLELFARNPQYLLSVYEHETRKDQRKDSIASAGSRYCCAVIALMQVRRRCMKHPGRKMMQIGFVVYRVRIFITFSYFINIIMKKNFSRLRN